MMGMNKMTDVAESFIEKLPLAKESLRALLWGHASKVVSKELERSQPHHQGPESSNSEGKDLKKYAGLKEGTQNMLWRGLDRDLA